jgi:4-amino-4-deoxy-L-arabinose transferase-like glycosyltransferase
MVMGRVAMSDVPSAAVVALGFYLFWHGERRHPGWWIASGVVAGASWAFRATNPLLFVPLFAGTLLRREWKCWALIVGGLLGLGIRFLSMSLYFGSGLFERSAYHLALNSIMDRLPLYLIGLLLFVPGGLLFGCLYRGRRRPEIIATIALIFFFFLLQHYSTQATSFVKRLVLALRYFVPLLPVLAFAMAESVPAALSALRSRGGGARRLAVGLGTASVAWVAVVGVASAAVHPLFNRWSATQTELRDVIARTLPSDAVYVTNWMGTRKFVDLFEQKYVRVERDLVTPRQVQLLVDQHAEVYVVFVGRSDSEHWIRDGERSEEFLASLRNEPELLVDHEASPVDRVRVWRLDENSPARK